MMSPTSLYFNAAFAADVVVDAAVRATLTLDAAIVSAKVSAQPFVEAQLTTSSGTGLRDIALAIIGTFTIVILTARAAGALADEQYGKLITLILASIPVIGFAYFPDTTVNILKGLFSSGVG
ncbi:hypothetical protein [Actinophytocola xanthii]|uniref:Uncharacterized protein n=1 Tax=Actinophytocola xanthii TaxID=1912961 RepID=A0A1Q8BYD9_9PSEU|nr:hypothetical protein [Actinophytocola xanthii]OLF07075.1 hypothetical protein BU204_35785 [Actinophytocola xanthii]